MSLDFNGDHLKYAISALALITLVLGLLASFYWLRASMIEVTPLWEQSGLIEPVIHSQSADNWIVALLESGKESGRRNAIAARWTAAAVVSGCLTSILGSWPAF